MIGPAIPSAEHVISFCASIVGGHAPIAVRSDPLRGEPFNDCFRTVPKHIKSKGGSQIIGWAIWERPGVFIEAEFHAIWKNQEDELVCVTHRQQDFSSITFLADPCRLYEGRQVDNIRKPLVKDNDVVRFLFLAKRRFEILNTGKLAEMHGEVSLPKNLGAEYLKISKEMERLQSRLGKRYGF